MILGDNNNDYTVTAHIKWLNRESSGVLHFDIHLEKLGWENIWFHRFHLRSSITKQIMTYWRKFMMLQPEEIMDGYTKVMKIFWTDLHIELWNLNKEFTSFKGLDILAFTKKFQTWLTLSRHNLRLPSFWTRSVML